MLRQRLQAALQARRARLAVVLLVLAVLAGSGYTVAMQGPASLEIIVQTAYTSFYGQPPYNPDVTVVFDKTITDKKLATDVKQALDTLPRGSWFGSCNVEAPGVKAYSYEFRFARTGVPTEVFSGSADCVTWTVAPLGGVTLAGLTTQTVIAPYGVPLYGSNFMPTMHTLTGMPLPNG